MMDTPLTLLAEAKDLEVSNAAFLAALERIKAAEAGLPEEPEFIKFLRHCERYSEQGHSGAEHLVIKYIDTLRTAMAESQVKAQRLRKLHDLNWAQKECVVCGAVMAGEGIDNTERAEKAEAEAAALQKKASRYEYLRTLNVPQFQALFVKSLETDTPFDDLVDAAIAENKP